MTPPQPRLVWIDQLRVIVVLLLFPFHSARVFDTWDAFYAKSDVLSAPLSWFVAYLSVWQMPLLFLLAGMSSSFALRKRSGRRFLGERALRLLVPFVFGCLVLVPPQVWYGARTNSGYTGSLPAFFGDYFSGSFGFISDYLGGPSFGQLWFILYLFVLSAVALPFLLWTRRPAGTRFAERTAERLARPAWWLLPPFLLLLMSAFPDLGGHNPFEFLVWFVLGYLMVATPATFETAERTRVATLLLGSALAVGLFATWGWKESFPDPSVERALHEYGVQGAGWLLALAAVGFARRHLDRAWPALPYLAEASYPTYILHQTAIAALGFYLVAAMPLPAVAWPVLTLGSAAVTYLVYELAVRRWRPARFLFGMKPPRTLAAVSHAPHEDAA